MQNLWLVDDDPTVIMELRQVLKSDYEITVFRTEEEFRRQYMDAADSSPPAAVVMDVALAWTNWDNPSSLPPIECSDEHKGGIRCRFLLAALPKTARVPVTFL